MTEVHAADGSFHLPGLPIPRTYLVGRETEVDVVGKLLLRDDVALVTLTGPGGVGKTRLALAVAERVATAYPDGVAFVSLGAIHDPDIVPAAIAQALDLRPTSSRSIPEQLRAFLTTRHLLLVLDNFEQVVDAAPAIGDLLTAPSDQTILVTSRLPLHLHAEREFPVSPLALPTPAQMADSIELAGNPSVALFVQRAQAVTPDFCLTPHHARVVAEICHRLDGLPLAIELAATRIKVLSPQALLARLTNRLALLTSGPRDAPSRQQTMRATIAWSYDLLPLREQRIFRLLAVFVSGWTLDAAEAVVTVGDGEEAGREILDGLTVLVDHSLVWHAPATAGASRFGMLEMVREYALEQLSASGDESSVRQLHAEFYLALAEQAAVLMEVSDKHWLDRLDAERENLRAAFAWLSECAATQECLRLVGALRGFWFHRGSFAEGLVQIESALTLPGADLPTAVRARALAAAGILAIWRGDDASSVPLTTEALAICRALDERAPQPSLLIAMGIAAMHLGEREQAVHYWEQSLALARELGDRVHAARSLSNLADLTVNPEDYDRRQSMSEEALALARVAGHHGPIHQCLTLLIEIALERGDYRQAAARLQEALALSANSGWQWQLVESFALVARLALSIGQPDVAARLIGAHDAFRERADMPVSPSNRVQHDQFLSEMHAALPGDAHAALQEAGQAMSPEDVLTVAKEILAVAAAFNPVPSTVPTPTPYGLSPREVEVLRLIADGLTDREIAGALSISHYTVMRHVSHVLNKLGVTSRTAAAAIALRQDLV